jgi:hypothetical protein
MPFQKNYEKSPKFLMVYRTFVCLIATCATGNR